MEIFPKMNVTYDDVRQKQLVHFPLPNYISLNKL